MKLLHVMTVGGLAALAAACTHATDTAGAPSFGHAVAAMQQMQTTPGEVSTEAPEGSGAQGTLAQTRYKNGDTRPLLSSTSSTANPSSGGSN